MGKHYTGDRIPDPNPYKPVDDVARQAYEDLPSDLQRIVRERHQEGPIQQSALEHAIASYAVDERIRLNKLALCAIFGAALSFDDESSGKDPE